MTNAERIRNMTDEELAEWLMQLKEYQSLEEQGRLIKLPCKVGDTVYVIVGEKYLCRRFKEQRLIQK